MGDLTVKVKKDGPEKTFPRIRSVTMIYLVGEINKKKLSLEEAEMGAGIKIGTMLTVLEDNKIPDGMDSYLVYDFLKD